MSYIHPHNFISSIVLTPPALSHAFLTPLDNPSVKLDKNRISIESKG